MRATGRCVSSSSSGAATRRCAMSGTRRRSRSGSYGSSCLALKWRCSKGRDGCGATLRVAEAGPGAVFYCATCNTGMKVAPTNAQGWPICPVCSRPSAIRTTGRGRDRSRPPTPEAHARAVVTPGGPLLVDASYREGWCAIAGVMREDGSQLFARVRPAPSSSRAETFAVRYALELLDALGWDREVWTDNRAVAERGGDRVVKVGRRQVRLAHQAALRELRMWFHAR